MGRSEQLPITYPRLLASRTIGMVMMPGGSPISSVPSMSKLTRVRVVSPPVGRTIAILARDGERVQGPAARPSRRPCRRRDYHGAVPTSTLSGRDAMTPWIVVGAVWITLAITFGLYFSFPVFFVALVEEF